MNDAGEYQVTAINDVGACTSKAKLTVYPRTNEEFAEEAPRFLSSLRDANADEGQILELSAPFVANPIPEIIWSKDGSKFDSIEYIFIFLYLIVRYEI